MGHLMFHTATTALMRAVLDEVCEGVSRREIRARTHVASKILKAATRGDVSPEGLRRIGREALYRAPSMWRSSRCSAKSRNGPNEISRETRCLAAYVLIQHRPSRHARAGPRHHSFSLGARSPPRHSRGQSRSRRQNEDAMRMAWEKEKGGGRKEPLFGLHLGLRNYTREHFELAQRAGEMLQINVLGLATSWRATSRCGSVAALLTFWPLSSNAPARWSARRN
jgi:hypothetical protein